MFDGMLSFEGHPGTFFCQTIYEAEGMRLHDHVNHRSLIFVEISPGQEQVVEDRPRYSVISAKLECKIVEYLLAHKKSEELHYITFYRDQKDFSHQC